MSRVKGENCMNECVRCGLAMGVIVGAMGCRSNSYEFDLADGGFLAGTWGGFATGPACPGANDAGVVDIDGGGSYEPGRCEADAPECVAYAPSCVDGVVVVRSWNCSCSGADWSCNAAEPVALGACESSLGGDSGTE